jgi:hypothetical protein
MRLSSGSRTAPSPCEGVFQFVYGETAEMVFSSGSLQDSKDAGESMQTVALGGEVSLRVFFEDT